MSKEFLEEIKKAIVEMPKRPTIVVKEGKVVGIKLNSAIIKALGEPNYVKPVNENYVDYLMGVKVYRDDTVSKPIYIVEGEIETIDNSKKNINSLYSNMHQTSDELDKSLKDSLLKNAKIEAIDNADPSEALDYINCFLNEMTYCLEHPKEYVKGYEKEIFYKYKYTFETTIKQALTTKHKKELAWDIVVKKNVDIALLKREKSVDSYNFCASLSPIKRDELTKKEFNLLKEVVK